MFPKIGIIVSFIAAIVNYNTDYHIFFWISIINGLFVFISSCSISYIIARPKIKEHKQIIREMEQRGNTSEEIEEFIDSDIKSSGLDNKEIPTWIAIINFLAIVMAFLLLVIGIINR